ncbi:hypothetical protein AB2B38_010175 [Balneola sp. MJW-20]|uniref:hypothetical protein n=1 Tax=Gracilimonas aurantiaca TaxID=3234185 RepID=UPI003466F7C0
MEEIRQKDIDWLLNLNEEFVRPELPSKPKIKSRFRFSTLLVGAALVITLAILPFFLLVRTSVYLEQIMQLNPWLSLLGGILSVIFLLGFYVLLLIRKLENRRLIMRYAMRGVSVMVAGFCLYGLFYISSLNAKDDNIREVYRSLHPVMRVAVSTLTLADKDLVITDISRTQEDYRRMGLPVNESSLHFRQASGFVHAIDLRTIGQPEWRNKLLEFTFKALGIHTIRHVGTADHLHVYLQV